MHFEEPFPHTVIDGFLTPRVLSEINNQWPCEEEFEKEAGAFQIKWNTPKLPPAAASVVSSINTADIESITGLDNIFPDPDLVGAGLHCIPSGGFLKMHVDFNGHPYQKWTRKVNVLIYVNQSWDVDWGGDLVLGWKQSKRIAPMPGRAVIFETGEETWHGHPEKLACPKHLQRRSIAVYFYQDGCPIEKEHTTVYRK